MQGGMVLDANWSYDGQMIAAGNNKSIMLFDIRYLHNTVQLWTTIKQAFDHKDYEYSHSLTLANVTTDSL